MGRDFRNVAVVKAYSAEGQFVAEEIISLVDFSASGSELINSAEVRRDCGVRFISLRLFDEAGNKVDSASYNFGNDGMAAKGLHRRFDGSIIEDAEKYL
jgi:hypothetical protein